MKPTKQHKTFSVVIVLIFLMGQGDVSANLVSRENLAAAFSVDTFFNNKPDNVFALPIRESIIPDFSSEEFSPFVVEFPKALGKPAFRIQVIKDEDHEGQFILYFDHWSKGRFSRNPYAYILFTIRKGVLDLDYVYPLTNEPEVQRKYEGVGIPTRALAWLGYIAYVNNLKIKNSGTDSAALIHIYLKLIKGEFRRLDNDLKVFKTQDLQGDKLYSKEKLGLKAIRVIIEHRLLFVSVEAIYNERDNAYLIQEVNVNRSYPWDRRHLGIIKKTWEGKYFKIARNGDVLDIDSGNRVLGKVEFVKGAIAFKGNPNIQAIQEILAPLFEREKPENRRAHGEVLFEGIIKEEGISPGDLRESHVSVQQETANHLLQEYVKIMQEDYPGQPSFLSVIDLSDKIIANTNYPIRQENVRHLLEQNGIRVASSRVRSRFREAILVNVIDRLYEAGEAVTRERIGIEMGIGRRAFEILLSKNKSLRAYFKQHKRSEKDVLILKALPNMILSGAKIGSYQIRDAISEMEGVEGISQPLVWRRMRDPDNETGKVIALASRLSGIVRSKYLAKRVGSSSKGADLEKILKEVDKLPPYYKFLEQAIIELFSAKKPVSFDRIILLKSA